ncbi:hypothetical protein DFQ28_009463 [Apophysomyces sp. BC1034]|nr:hypothetical protein DFQ30_010942 [Apophysomyces sp. BC1015]KAG0172992.1 hypothetical protein DFQ29_008141 [Apophysomyces sp. BC1021]KAG0185379.1 hypothetical protein DFQ28_009463 [Apophysomyces sp. BC1034]
MSIHIHPAYKVLVKKIRSGVNPSTLTVSQLREHLGKIFPPTELADVHVEEHKIIAGPNKAELVLTVLRPVGTEKDILPVTLYLHGGGWVTGDRAMYGRPIQDLAIQTNAAVAFVEYSLSPEIKFPVAQEECCDTVKWILKNHSQIRVNPDKLVIAGDSAGGNLSAAVTLMAKERGFVDKIKAQVLIYPALAEAREEYESYHVCGAGDYILSKGELAWSYDLAFGEEVRNNKLAVPIVASLDDLKDLPPALILTAEADPLRDEGEAYARKLIDAGVSTAAVRVLSAVHGFINPAGEAPHYKFAIGTIASYINDVFRQ